LEAINKNEFYQIPDHAFRQQGNEAVYDPQSFWVPFTPPF
jgi:hypothetical protein